MESSIALLGCTAREEGLKTFYRGMPPQLVRVVPMIGIQFGVHEFMKRVLQEQSIAAAAAAARTTMLGTSSPDVNYPSTSEETPDSSFQETMLEVEADPTRPFPAPHFHLYEMTDSNNNNNKSKQSGDYRSILLPKVECREHLDMVQRHCD